MSRMQRAFLAGLIAGTLVLAAALAVLWWRAAVPEPPPVLGTAPGFELTDQHGRTVGSDELRGRPLVLDFVFTRCVAVCPAMSAQMERLREDRPEDADFHRVSITLDPEHDTPDVLRRYAAKRGAPDDWLFLTAAEQETTVSLARDGFHLAVETDTGDPANPIVHSTRFVLIDGEGRIRGYYDALTPEAMAELRRDLGVLLSIG